MANKNISARIQNKYDLASNWATNNPILLAGELGIERDTLLVKIGDGVTRWNSLEYINNFQSSSVSEGLSAVNTDTASMDALVAAGAPLILDTTGYFDN